jgi:uncharacterized protein with PQ loop repeat
MTQAELLGWIGGTITVGSIVAQTVRVARTRSTADLSWGWIVLFVAGSVFWGTNGFLSDNRPLWVANAVMLALMAVITAVKVGAPVEVAVKRLSREDHRALHREAIRRGLPLARTAEALLAEALRTPEA